MIEKTVNLNLDLNAPPAILHVTQGDTAWEWHFRLFMDGSRWTIPTGAQIIFKGLKPDGHVFAFSGAVSSNEAVVTSDLQMTICAGEVPCSLIILDANAKRLAFGRITMYVAADAEGQFDVASESALPAYVELLEQYAQIIDEAASIPDDLPGYIQTNVDAWLVAHPEATTTVQDGAVTKAKLAAALVAELTPDATLTASGKPADAKATGDKIDNLKSALERTIDLSDDLMLSKIVTWEHGTISGTYGTDEGSSTTRARTIGYISTDWSIDVNRNRSGVVYGVYLCYYDVNYNFVYRSSQIFEDTHIIPDASYAYYRVTLLNRLNDDLDINLVYLPNDLVFTSANKTLTTIKESVDDLVGKVENLYIGELINGHLTATGLDDDIYSDYRLSTAEIVALPSGSSRKIRVRISEGYLVALRTGARSDDLGHNLYWYANGDVITIPDGDNYYAISCCANVGPTSYVTQAISPEEVERINLGLLVYSGGVAVDPEAEKVINASRLRFDSGSTPNTLKNIIVITHTSDCHGDYSRVKNFFDFSDRIHADLAAVTGDIVSYKPYQKLDWFKGIVNAAVTRAAVCVGNHDAYDDSLNDAGVYSLVFDGITSKIGNATGKTWYYIDLADKALRVISVNLYQYGGSYRSYTHFTDEQLAWLCSTLASTPSGYGVLLLYHSPQVNLSASENYGKFYQNVRKYANIHNAVAGSPINDIIDAFIGRTTITKTYTQTGSPASVNVSGDFTGVDSSVEFIAHLTGHFHQDSVCYVPGTAHLQLMLNVVCTNAIYGGTVYPYLCDLSDLPRNNEDATQNSFNVYAIDRREGVVRITRVGSNTAYTMQKRDYMSIPYKS